jgi:hypothetical protein
LEKKYKCKKKTKSNFGKKIKKIKKRKVEKKYKNI